MHRIVTSLPFLLLAVACSTDSEPRRGGAAHQLAKACAVEVETAAAALAGDSEIEPAPAPEPAPEPVPDPGPGDDDEPGLPIACCTNPAGCTPMDYPDDICVELTVPDDATELALHSLQPYDSDTTTAFFANCEPPPGGGCDPDTTPYVFEPYPDTRWVVAFVDDGFGNKTAELYHVPAGTTAVKIPSGAEVFPLLPASHGFADLNRPVTTPDGVLYVDKQNDCIPRPDGCGFTCFTC